MVALRIIEEYLFTFYTDRITYPWLIVKADLANLCY